MRVSPGRSRQSEGRQALAVLVQAMIEVQKHRGPDGAGIFEGGDFEGGNQRKHVVLGHGRLAIIDLSLAASQPMTSRDGRWTIVFNGEIFNYVELRAQLGGHGACFRTSSDTEVLLEACALWGVTQTLEQTAGMFAFALWDAAEKELTLARDRFGEKPLVYFWDGRTFAFASELKALAPLHQRQLDAQAVDAYLALGYVPAPLAIFRNCHKLEAGSLLRLKTGGEPRTERWWFGRERERDCANSGYGAGDSARVAVPVPAEHRPSLVRQYFGRAVAERLRADVPIALSLSGGIDSSVIAAECVRQGIRPVAFTVRFRGTSFVNDSRNHGEDDVRYARMVAQKLGLTHEILEAGPASAGEDSLEAAFDNALQNYDEPFADSSALACLELARALRGRYKVILNGDGGDEVFGGYRHYERIAAKQWIKRGAACAGLLDGRGAEGVYVASKALFRKEDRQYLMNGHGLGDALTGVVQRLIPGGPHTMLHKAMSIDLQLQLASGLNHKLDIALGSCGIEGRAPFLDHRLAGWAATLPVGDLVSGREKKILLRAAYRDDLPAGVLARDKRGFGAPVDQWLNGALGARARRAVPCPLLEPKHQHNLSGQRLWTLLVFSEWARHWKAGW